MYMQFNNNLFAMFVSDEKHYMKCKVKMPKYVYYCKLFGKMSALGYNLHRLLHFKDINMVTLLD